jgi:hypothetical protein
MLTVRSAEQTETKQIEQKQAEQPKHSEHLATSLTTNAITSDTSTIIPSWQHVGWITTQKACLIHPTNNFYIKLSKYLSASNAAIQPDPAEVTAWR